MESISNMVIDVLNINYVVRKGVSYTENYLFYVLRLPRSLSSYKWL